MKKLLLLLALISCEFMLGQSIISVTPDNGNRGQTLQVSITGQDTQFYTSSPTINVSFIDQFLNVLPATWAYALSDSQVYLNLSIPGYAVPGQYDVKVYAEDGAFNLTLDNGFTVNNNYTYTIQGNIRYDSNNNGCDETDINFPNQRLIFTNGSNSGNLIANESGFYSYYDVQVGNNIFIPILQNPSYFTVTPPSASVTFPTASNVYVQDFCILANGTHNDLTISLLPIVPARPGFDALYKIVYKNNGTGAQNGTINLGFDDSVMDLISATPGIDGQSTNSLSWNFSNLLPFESREIFVNMNINAPTETPPINNGSILIYNASINGASDETPSDNSSTFNQTVVGSYDPNDKTCVEGTKITPSMVGDYLNYVIRFENTGTANAEFVVIRDEIDMSKFDITTLVPTGSSHSFTTRILNTNKVEFIFENINLPFDDANNDGFIAFKIKTRPTLVVGNTISNTASIFFDYNLPIITNTYTTTIETLGKQDFEFNSVFTLSPVPAKNNLTITTKQDVIMSSLNIYNTLGQLIQVITNPSPTIDVSSLTTGSYFIKII
ncbi:MAG: T9SS type A sorting domain-containing protein [Flavobacterium sp.]|nr:T9SS type A sorting domain-containing protein [Flavobacterium sp.]